VLVRRTSDAEHAGKARGGHIIKAPANLAVERTLSKRGPANLAVERGAHYHGAGLRIWQSNSAPSLLSLSASQRVVTIRFLSSSEALSVVTTNLEWKPVQVGAAVTGAAVVVVGDLEPGPIVLGEDEGVEEGDDEGELDEGDLLGADEGDSLGADEGDSLGAEELVGDLLGAEELVGDLLGEDEGVEEGDSDGVPVLVPHGGKKPVYFPASHGKPESSQKEEHLLEVTFQPPMSWLNADAFLKVEIRVFTAHTSQPLMSLLNADAT
jgi:hypothetical protein